MVTGRGAEVRDDAHEGSKSFQRRKWAWEAQ